MFDSIFDNIFILIPIAIIIGRIVVQARKKKQPPPPPPRRRQPVIPVHFEDDKEDRPPRREVKVQSIIPAAPQYTAVYEAGLSNSEALVDDKVNLPRKAPSEPRAFTFNLNNLSAMKQAVVMAEILGPPKGMV